MGQDGHLLLARLASLANVPAGVHLQVADRCNHACVHCYQVQGRKGELDTAGVFAILDDLAAAGVMILNVSGGEATLRSDLLDILRHARRKGFALRLFTNAYTMTPELAVELARIGILGVDISLYSDDSDQHDSITRVPGSHAKTLLGVRALLGAGVRVHLKVPVTSLVPDARTRVQRVADALNEAYKDTRGDVSVVSSVEITPTETGDLHTHELAPDPFELVRRGELSKSVDPLDRGAAIKKARAEASCGACKEGITVLSNGDLRPCTDIVAPLGNLRDKSFAELYASPEVALVRDLTWNDVHGCRDCDLLPGCQRCHASASLEAGDLLGPYPSACRGARARFEGEPGTLVVRAGTGVDRSPELGPYRIVEPGVLETKVDEVTADDEARRARFSWIRPSKTYFESMSHGESNAKRRLPLVGGAR